MSDLRVHLNLFALVQGAPKEFLLGLWPALAVMPLPVAVMIGVKLSSSPWMERPFFSDERGR